MDFDSTVSFGDPQAITLRDYQADCVRKIADGWKHWSRLLAVLLTSGGKTIIFSFVTREEVAKGGRVLILAHTDELCDQAMEKLERSTGIVAEKEKAGSHASLSASVVVGSIQTLSRDRRLLGFPDNHFSLVIVDECDLSLAASWMKVLKYFHFGEHSLAEDWQMPTPEEPYIPKAKVLGVTATPDRGDRKSLGEFYQKCVFEYGILEGVRNGYAVRPIVRNIPLKIDLRGVNAKTMMGVSDYDQSEVVQRILPFIGEIAKQIAANAKDRKTVVFMPSIETSKIMAWALAKEGLSASFVSGECPDRKEKIAAFDAAPNGSAICCAMVLLRGWDCTSASCIAMLRVTKVRSLLVQAVGRVLRVLPGVIDGLQTAEERLAAIAASPKKNARILDFLWLTDRLDLIRPADLVAKSPEEKQKMMESGNEDLIEAEEEAEKELLGALEKEARRHRNKKSREFDLVAFSVAVGDATIASYKAETKWDELPAHPKQIEFLKGAGLVIEQPLCRGLAEKLTDRIISRQKMNLATIGQMKFLAQLGMPEEEAALLSRGKAGVMIQVLKKRKILNRQTYQ